MIIDIKPQYGKSYTKGNFYFTYTDGNIVSKGISWFTYKGDNHPDLEKVSHVGLCIGDGMGIAAKGEFRKVDYEDLNELFADTKTRIFFKEPKNLTKDLADMLHLKALRYLGTPYDYKLAMGIGVVNSWFCRKFLTETTRDRLLRQFSTPGHLICSGFANLLQFITKISTTCNLCVSPKQVLFSDVWKEWKDYPNDKEQRVCS